MKLIVTKKQDKQTQSHLDEVSVSESISTRIWSVCAGGVVEDEDGGEVGADGGQVFRVGPKVQRAVLAVVSEVKIRYQLVISDVNQGTREIVKKCSERWGRQYWRWSAIAIAIDPMVVQGPDRRARADRRSERGKRPIGWTTDDVHKNKPFIAPMANNPLSRRRRLMVLTPQTGFRHTNESATGVRWGIRVTEGKRRSAVTLRSPKHHHEARYRHLALRSSGRCHGGDRRRLANRRR